MSKIQRKIIRTDKAPKAIGPYSVGIKSGDFVFTSGQLGLDPASNELSPGGIQAETRQSLTNLKHILEAAGSSLGNVVKTTVFLRDMADFALMNAVYAEFFQADQPARTTVGVAALPKGAAVEIEAVAVLTGG